MFLGPDPQTPYEGRLHQMRLIGDWSCMMRTDFLVAEALVKRVAAVRQLAQNAPQWDLYAQGQVENANTGVSNSLEVSLVQVRRKANDVCVRSEISYRSAEWGCRVVVKLVCSELFCVLQVLYNLHSTPMDPFKLTFAVLFTLAVLWSLWSFLLPR